MNRMIVISLLFLSTAACNKGGGGGPSVSPQARQEAQTLFSTRCAVCHGERGTGDGPGAAALNPRPRNFQDKAWQGAITDAQIDDIIKKGGAAVGKSAAMPPNPDLADKAEVVMALRAHIRGLAQ
jgi:mono/diheme cytochrome c family protein